MGEAPHRRRDGQRGFTLVELLVAMTLVTILIGVAFQIAIVVLTGHKQHREAVATQRAARGAIDLIADAVRNGSAGVPTGNLTDATGCTSFNAISVIDDDDGPDELSVMTAAGAVVTTLYGATIDESASEMTVLDGGDLSEGDQVMVTDFETGHVLRVNSVTDNGGSWAIGVDTSTCAGVDFEYSAGALVLRFRVSRFYVEDLDGVPTMFLDPDSEGDEAAEPLAEGIEDFQVAIGVDLDDDGEVLDEDGAPDEWFHDQTGEVAPDLLTSPWRALRLTVVARSMNEDPAGDVSARPQVEDRDGASIDGFRRRMVSTVVEIRNLEGSP